MIGLAKDDLRQGPRTGGFCGRVGELDRIRNHRRSERDLVI